jgi:PhzF family phenazine biosynthesis protein
MTIPYYEVLAFTSRLFAGNPAGVCVLQEWLPDALLQKIAAENNLAETAFFIDRGSFYEIRWMTPTVEWIFADMPPSLPRMCSFNISAAVTTALVLNRTAAAP